MSRTFRRVKSSWKIALILVGKHQNKKNLKKLSKFFRDKKFYSTKSYCCCWHCLKLNDVKIKILNNEYKFEGIKELNDFNINYFEEYDFFRG